jgi:hypothetical protein
MGLGYRAVVLRSTASRGMAVLVVVACAVAEAAIVAFGDPALMLRGSAPLAFGAVAAWVLFWIPEVRVDPAEVVLVNPLRTVTVRWPAITDVRTRWGLELVTTRGRYSAWAAPRSGAIGAGRAARLEVRRREVGASTPREAVIRDAASAAASIVLRQWESYRDEGLLGAVEGEGVEVRPRTTAIAVLGLLLVAVVAAAFVP